MTDEQNALWNAIYRFVGASESLLVTPSKTTNEETIVARISLESVVDSIFATKKAEADTLAFNAQRLRNVAVLVGVDQFIPEDDETLDGARGTVLGTIAAKLRLQKVR